MTDELHTLKGVGPKSEKLFGKIGICDLGQLLHYYPRAYDACTEPVPYDRAVPGQRCAVYARVSSRPVLRKNGPRSVLILNLKEEGIRLEAVWFNVPYLVSRLKPGSVFVLRGTFSDRNGRLCLHQPEIYSPADYGKIMGSIRPVYSLTASLSNKTVIKAVEQVLEGVREEEYLPEEIRERYGFPELNTALHDIHFPQNENDLMNAKRRLVFDEFFFYLTELALIKGRHAANENTYRTIRSAVSDGYLKSLPFELTGAQMRAWESVKAELSGDLLMNRLLQGDVGSGKTVIAFLAMMLTAENGYQAALMAPTEVLAMQHYRSLCEAVRPIEGLDAPVLLTGSLSPKEKRAVQEDIASGRPKLIVGTHALIQDKAVFKDLGLVITDEQHRFGVGQRALFSDKGKRPHVLIMSATPIPRTLALILYGNMDVSVIDEMPKERLPVKNCVVDPGYRKTAYKFILDEVRKGHQAYVVCPMIEENEDLDCEDVITCTERLKEIFPGSVRIESLHGRMRPEEKNDKMARFAAGEIDILVSTTVIEVGVDVANATVMMVENADRFGLSGLHQLRGRIGRGKDQSYCIFINSGGKDVSERLNILVSSNDGFHIASEDLKLRGQGDLFGLRQSGEAGFALADPLAYPDILEAASETSQVIMSEDPGLVLDKNTSIRKAVQAHEQDLFSDTL